MAKRVTAGKTYTFNPAGMDQWDPSCEAEEGQKVTVVNLPGCPKANTMGHCHIQDSESEEFLGLCLTNSLK
jgi:hypothetical protein